MQWNLGERKKLLLRGNMWCKHKPYEPAVNMLVAIPKLALFIYPVYGVYVIGYQLMQVFLGHRA